MSSSRRSRSKAGLSADNLQNIASTSRAQSRNVAKEGRRIRGEIACAECRRLKIRCDRKVPCSTCVTRGCAVLCPNDVLPPGDNSRHVDFATDHLQQKIAQMDARMRLLEDALQVAQIQQSNEQHPLLKTPFKFEDEEDIGGEEDVLAEGVHVDDLTDVMGSLHINEKDKSVQFYGPTGGAESLLREGGKRSVNSPAVRDNTTPMALRALGLPQEFDVFFLSFPFTPMGIPRQPVRLAIEALLPARGRAEALCEIFMENLSWMFQIVSLSYLKKELIPAIYRRGVGDTRRVDDYSHHDLALMLIVLAIGALVDISQKPYNAEAHRYAAMARTAAGLQPLMENISLASVKFTHLLSIYNGMCGKESAMSNTYALLNVASIMAQKIGLHMDPSLWNLDEKTCYVRRAYFWDLIQADLWLSLSSGRPPALSNSGAHCKFPTEEEERKFRVGEKPMGFGTWGFRYTQNCLLPLARHVNSTTPPAYQTVLDLEKKFVSSFLPTFETLGKSESVSISMRAWVRSHYRELILLFLHRAFFAKAIATHPDNPLQSPYVHSFKTAYQCACVVLRTTEYQHGIYPDLLSRVWQIWTFAFTSAVIVGAVATRTHQLDLDPPPFKMFDDTCKLFRDAASISPRAAKALPVLMSMHEKASRLHPQGHESSPYLPPTGTLSPGGPSRDEEVAIFAGKTRIVAQSLASPSPIPSAYHLPHSIQPLLLLSTQARSEHLWRQPQQPTNHPPPFQDFGMHSRQSFSAYPGHDQPIASSSSTEVPEQWGGQGLGLTIDPSDPALYQIDSGTPPPVDFLLHDTWTNFLQDYGAMPPHA